MGGRLAGLRARQHPHLTSQLWRAAVLTLLAIDGVLSALAGALFLPLRLGSTPLLLGAVASGLVNAALVWAASQVTPSPRVAALPLWTWLVTVAVLSLKGPGGDIVFGGAGLMEYAVLVLMVLGVAPPAAVLWRHTR